MQVRREETHAHGPAQVEPDGHRPGLFGRSRRSYTHAFQSSRLTIFSRSPSTGVPRLSRYVRQQSRSGPPIRARFFSRSMTLASVGCASAPGSPSVSTLWVIVRAPVGRGVHLVVDPAPAAHYARESVVRVVGAGTDRHELAHGMLAERGDQRGVHALAALTPLWRLVGDHQDRRQAVRSTGVRADGSLSWRPSPGPRCGNRALLRWMRGFGDVCQVGVEGTGSYGAGVTRHLSEVGIEVFEVARPDRSALSQQGQERYLRGGGSRASCCGRQTNQHTEEQSGQGRVSSSAAAHP